MGPEAARRFRPDPALPGAFAEAQAAGRPRPPRWAAAQRSPGAPADPGRPRLDLGPVFQPIVDAAAGRIFAQEALIRGADGASAGAVFAAIPAADRAGFEARCRRLAIERAGKLGLRAPISLNMRPDTLLAPEYGMEACLRAAAETGWPPAQIIIELTEDAPLPDPAQMRRAMEAGRAAGLRFAIDDFGAGHAGLGLLTEIRPEILKLDMALVRGAPADPTRQAILLGVAQICERLGLTAVAEGVETVEERDWLLSNGFPIHQGQLYGRPNPRGAPVMEALADAAAAARAAGR